MSEIDATLEERNKTHGDFLDDASLAQHLKRVIHRHKGWERLGPDQQEALDHISTKISRILNGNPNHFDSWHDIAGYAQLVAKRLAK
jgi:hypothetical protein